MTLWNLKKIVQAFDDPSWYRARTGDLLNESLDHRKANYLSSCLILHYQISLVTSDVDGVRPPWPTQGDSASGLGVSQTKSLLHDLLCLPSFCQGHAGRRLVFTLFRNPSALQNCTFCPAVQKEETAGGKLAHLPFRRRRQSLAPKSRLFRTATK